jgi:hypothetical protein
MGERYDMVRTVRDERYRYIRNYSPHRPWGQHIAYMWMANGYQSWESEHRAGRLDRTTDAFWGPKPSEEFYDTATDPDEVRNLIDDPGHAATIQAMRDALDKHMTAINDNGFIPEGSPIEGYHASRQPGAYPLPEVMDLAAQAIRREPTLIDVLTTALAHPNEVMRYWGAQGLLMLGSANAPAAAALRQALTDPSPQVRVAAAEAYAQSQDHGPAITALAEVLSSDIAAPAKLQALNALTALNLDESNAPLAEIMALAEVPDPNLRSASRYLLLAVRGEYTPDKVIFEIGHIETALATIM